MPFHDLFAAIGKDNRPLQVGCLVIPVVVSDGCHLQVNRCLGHVIELHGLHGVHDASATFLGLVDLLFHAAGVVQNEAQLSGDDTGTSLENRDLEGLKLLLQAVDARDLSRVDVHLQSQFQGPRIAGCVLGIEGGLELGESKLLGVLAFRHHRLSIDRGVFTSGIEVPDAGQEEEDIHQNGHGDAKGELVEAIIPGLLGLHEGQR
mmetsp:Transcript_53911/g.126443  ORF Transcript_53911/g.126443 Transcript_53911/m.126443 type:complete len:205 (-) Transcript_53911:84-698(-)